MFSVSLRWILLVSVTASASCGSTTVDELESRLDAVVAEQRLQRAKDAERMKQLESIVASQQRSLSSANQRIIDLELENALMKNIESRRQIQNSEARAAFSAYLDHDVDGLTDGQTITFNVPLYNHGNDYDPSTGVFTAPADGVYLFIYFIGNRHGREVDAALIVNGIMQNEAVAEGVQTNHDTQGGNAAILELSTRDRVWVKTTLGTHIEGQWRFSSFTGTLLYLN